MQHPSGRKDGGRCAFSDRFRRVFAPLALALLTVLGGTCALRTEAGPKPAPENGRLDLRGWDFARQGVLQLDGTWAFEWNRLVAPAEPLSGGQTAPVPGFFADESIGRQNLGHATYRLKILTNGETQPLGLSVRSVYSSYRVFIGDELVAGAGTPGTTAESAQLFFRPSLVRLPPLGSETDLTIQVANYHHRAGGLRGPLRLGAVEDIFAEQRNAIATALFLSGSFLVMGLYHVAVFVLLRRARGALYFAVACLAQSLRVLLLDDRYLLELLPWIDGTLLLRLEYLTIFVLIVALTGFIRELFPDECHRLVVRTVAVLYAGATLLVLLGPTYQASYTIPYLHWPLSMLVCVYVFGVAIVAAFRRREGALLFLGGILVTVLAGLASTLYWAGIAATGEMTSFALLALIFSQGVLLAKRYATTLFRSESLARDLARNNEELVETNRAVSRFVPRDFLTHLGRERITEVKLGDQAEREMTVLFSDIRDFTRLSESMTPQENFNFINSYLRRMEPLIAEHRGFIDKYIGDAIMALFAGDATRPTGAEPALRAALAMVNALEPYNSHRAGQSYAPINIGIGLNTGRLMLGTVGGANRMDGTVISDAVNLAARIESLCRHYGARLLISEYSRGALPDPQAYEMRPADRVVVKGRSEAVTVYEVFSADEPTLREQKRTSLAAFESAHAAYLAGDFTTAREGFAGIATTCPGDAVAAHLLERSRHHEKHGTPDAWDGASVLGTK